MAYRTSKEYFEDIQRFIEELSNDGKVEASKRMKSCFEYINGQDVEWKMFYKNLIFMKDEFSYGFSSNENIRLDQIIEAAKRIMVEW